MEESTLRRMRDPKAGKEVGKEVDVDAVDGGLSNLYICGQRVNTISATFLQTEDMESPSASSANAAEQVTVTSSLY